MVKTASNNSRREEAKEERRARIVEAAFQLLHEYELDRVSVAMIAKRAGVSAATVYNLFGTKGAVLLKVYDRDLESFRRRVEEVRTGDALDAIFQSVEIATEFYRRDPAFYRHALVAGAASVEMAELNSLARGSRLAFWEDQINAAIDEGFLRSDTDVRRLGQLFGYITLGALVDWVSGLIGIDEFEANARFGFGVALMSVATEAARPRVQAASVKGDRPVQVSV